MSIYSLTHYVKGTPLEWKVPNNEGFTKKRKYIYIFTYLAFYLREKATSKFETKALPKGRGHLVGCCSHCLFRRWSGQYIATVCIIKQKYRNLSWLNTTFYVSVSWLSCEAA
jgi:hypothetical protein